METLCHPRRPDRVAEEAWSSLPHWIWGVTARGGTLDFVAKAWWLLATAVCACSSPDDGADTSSQPAGWLSVTLSEPTGDRQCSGAAPTPYEFGSEARPLAGQVTCTVHWLEDDAWFWGHLADSRTSAGGNNLGFTISTEQGLSLSLVIEITGALVLDTNDGAACAPTFTAFIDDAASIEFDCPLLIHPTEPTEGCGVRGIANFENCDTEE